MQYIVTNGHVVENTHIVNTEADARAQGFETEVRVYFSAAENDYVIAQTVFYSAPEDIEFVLDATTHEIIQTYNKTSLEVVPSTNTPTP